MKERRFTPNVSESEKITTTKNGRRQLRVKCASCGITQTRFLPGNGDQKGGALSSRRGPSYVASNFVNPVPSFTGMAKIVGSHALKGVTDNVKYFRKSR